MSDVLTELLPVMVGAAVVPLYPIIVLMLLQSPRGLVLGTAMTNSSEGEQWLIASAFLLVMGILLLVVAFKKWRREEDPDDPPPQWIIGLNDLSGLRALSAGAVYVIIGIKQWVFTLSAIGIIAAASLGPPSGVTLYLFYILITQILVLPPILFYALAPKRATKPLQTAQSWLKRHNRVIVVTVSLIFGLWFAYKWITGLIA